MTRQHGRLDDLIVSDTYRSWHCVLKAVHDLQLLLSAALGGLELLKELIGRDVMHRIQSTGGIAW